ncbi:6211_t:CDS:2 [Ambispora leptoticha]|uniref:6211_t:CDS:1 n=1 Tax=Ambispora leptoticha TaxID=144679 RepID=A0A9N9C690_9GLOM|nr:6211_t:CDS:2 [Ambispora leptoticha]
MTRGDIPTRREIQEILESESEVIRWLQDNEIIYKNLTCHQCKNEMKQINKLLIELYYLWLIQVSPKSIGLMTGHSTTTITNNIDKIRQMIGSQYHRRKPVKGVWVIGGVERTHDRRIFVKTINKRDKESVLQIIKDNVEKGSIIYTDQWKAYDDITPILGNQHGNVNHSKYFKDPETGIHTNTIEGNWNGLKILIPARNRNKERIEPYLLEYVWRRQYQGQLWTTMIKAIRNELLIEDKQDDKPKMEVDVTGTRDDPKQP